MSDDTRTLQFVSDVEPSTVGRVVRTALALAGLLFLLGLAAVLPGIDRLLAGLAISPAALLLAVGTLLVVAALLWVAPGVERLIEQALDGPKGAVGNAAAAGKLLVGFLAVAVAYRGFEPALTPLFEAFEVGGVYHLGFLVAGLLVLAALARRLYYCWEPVSRLATTEVLEATGGSRSGVGEGPQASVEE